MELSHVFKNEPEGHGERLAERVVTPCLGQTEEIRRGANIQTNSKKKKKRFGTILMECNVRNQFMGALKEIPGVNL